MTVTVVQVSAAAATWSASFSCTPTLPSGSTSGNRIILPWAHHQFDASSTTVSSTGYTSQQLVNNTDNKTSAGLLDKAAAGTAETPTVVATNGGSASNSFGGAVLIEVSGLSASSPFVVTDSATAASAGTALSVSSGNPLSQSSGIAIVGFCGANSLAGGTWPPTNVAWVDVHSSLTSGFFSFAYFIYSSTAQLTAAMTITGASQWAGFIAIYQAASSAFTLPAANGSYAISGQNASLITKMPAAAGSYGINGQAATLTAFSTGYVLLANSGTYDYIGAQAISDFSVSASFGPYAITGQNATLTTLLGLSMSAVAGSYAISGDAVTLTFLSPSFVLMPNVVGMEYFLALKALQNKGFHNTSLNEVTVMQGTSGQLIDFVIAQAPAAGSEVVAGAFVTLTVNKLRGQFPSVEQHSPIPYTFFLQK